MGRANWLVLGAGSGAALILWTARHPCRHSAAPVRTVIVHAAASPAAHFPLSGWQIVVIAAVLTAAALAIALNLIARLP